MPTSTHRVIGRYGWKPSLPDPRDKHADTTGLAVLDEVDPRGEMQDPYDQLQIGSCTANAVCGALEYDGILDGASAVTPARLALYWLERFIEGGLDNTQNDTGAFGRDGFKAAKQYGWIPEKDFPYDPDKLTTDPRRLLLQDKSLTKLTKDYRAVTRTVEEFRRVLSNRQTVAIGFSVFESFESEQVASTGVMPIPKKGEQMLGGHEVLVVGYLKAQPDYALVRNSWGTSWGQGGYFLMPWKILMDGASSSDFRTIYRPAS